MSGNYTIDLTEISREKRKGVEGRQEKQEAETEGDNNSIQTDREQRKTAEGSEIKRK